MKHVKNITVGKAVTNLFDGLFGSFEAGWEQIAEVLKKQMDQGS